MIARLHPEARRLRTLFLVVFAGLLTACQRGVLNPAGDVARQQRDIIYISTGLMLLIIVPVMHLVYAITWFGLAALCLAGLVLLFRREP